MEENKKEKQSGNTIQVWSLTMLFGQKSVANNMKN